MLDAVDTFQADTDLRLLPILDERRRPVGAIFEKDVRRLLLNPFGHALLRNPSIGGNLWEHVRPCPTMEMTDDVGAIIDHYRRTEAREGMILTVNGVLHATLSNRRLLILASERQQQTARGKLERAQRIEACAAAFESGAAALATQMVQLANGVQRLAEATVDRSNIAGACAVEMGAAAVQSRDSMTYVAGRSERLAAAFGTIEQNLSGNRKVADETVARVAEGSARARELFAAARSIDNVMALISDIAGTVNLLSLNATIEAARAGEAGRGFAVVASEIRKLSDQTQGATEVIAGEVNSLKIGIEMVANDYAKVELGIEAMVASAAEIDHAITAEGDATRLIAHSVAEAGQASVSIQQAIDTIVQSVRSASISAGELDRMANDLRSSASALEGGVATFLTEVRAA